MAYKNGMSTLKEKRIALGHSLRSAAKRIEINPSYLWRIEQGERRPSVDVAERIAKWYGVSELQLLYPERYR